jgi:hypothetical protein
MSLRYKGARLSATPPTTTGGTTGTGSAPGEWTLQQQYTAQSQGAWPSAANYIEDAFNTWVYTGNGSTVSVNNGIDLSTKGGLVWFKDRISLFDHRLFDTARGATQSLSTDLTTAQTTGAGTITFSTNGFTTPNNEATSSRLSETYVAWTFRKQANFFDIVTYTGTGANRTVAHNLGSVPGCIMVKRTDAAADWQVYHRSLANTEYLVLNSTAASATGTTRWNSTTPTATEFSLGTDTTVNASGGTYVAYLFAHNAGGFGANGTDNVISCGSYLGSDYRSNQILNLGYEAQWVLIKNVTTTPQRWVMVDNMRGMSVSTAASDAWLFANSTAAETTTTTDQICAASTGFYFNGPESDVNEAGSTFVYIAIRRGPMKTPTSGTSVFGLSARSGTGANATVTGGQTDDAVLIKNRGAAVGELFVSRLTNTGYLDTSAIAAEVNAGTTLLQANPFSIMDGIKVGTTSTITNASANTFINYLFKRAPGFFDVVCYTGTGVARTVTHNLGVAPELMIVKIRSGTNNWIVYSNAFGNGYYSQLNTTGAFVATDATVWNLTNPTTSVFSVGTALSVNGSASTYIAYLFASVTGVSKVGSYTGDGASKTIDCGFAAGARFVMIKRTDSAGNWFVWDTARGINAAGINDPYFSLNVTSAEVTTNDSLSSQPVGFGVIQNATTNINVSAATYIYLAIA